MQKTEQARQLELLERINAEVSMNITAFDIDDAETLYDDEEDSYYLHLHFSKGRTSCTTTITHDGQLINYSSKIPRILLGSLHNVITRTMNTLRFGELYAWADMRGSNLKTTTSLSYKVLLLPEKKSARYFEARRVEVKLPLVCVLNGS